MRRHLSLAILFTAALTNPIAAVAGVYRPARTYSGQPDLQGLWSSSSLTRLERPSAFKSLVASDVQAKSAPFLLPQDEIGSAASEWFDPGLTLARIRGQFRTSWIVDPADGRLPYSETGRRNLKATNRTMDGPESRPMNERCLSATAGPPMVNGLYNNNWQIVQTRDYVAILMEYNHELRVIPLRNVKALPPQLHPWMGDAVGSWDGDTLVIHTTNFNPGQARRSGGLADYYLSDQAKVTERFTRISTDQIIYSYIVDDPMNYTRTWRGEMPLTATKGPLYEYACHEGNYSLPGILAGARREEAVAKAAPTYRFLKFGLTKLEGGYADTGNTAPLRPQLMLKPTGLITTPVAPAPLADIRHPPQ